ncbi:EscU/YscU/HrcU family type III secretion system export apparatus switch protein [Neobacillus sp. PS3-12]|jgi:flagellar biosynthesis protein|uniref:EscU/YscU/HrcU family type III secretion system export apparatus switch protein n=1 Tax=Neobacillus sp. PS3-12 TaxID=3070677 RepID=UPI0027E1761B|nr:EscU/YscU/HrcU family type III secretion system export apparatus switch protein [Neobacillus sp. PS3-12]WML51983.1 EscU/YscU/HrcU family type III secretion system export apparatus switch protein [Neobacillus sp. PS3-12]
MNGINGNSRKKAVALSYDSDASDAPVVTAKGMGETADKIIEAANKHHIPIQEDSTLVNLLGKLDVNEKIPQELYQAVAEVFSFIYKLDIKVEK